MSAAAFSMADKGATRMNLTYRAALAHSSMSQFTKEIQPLSRNSETFVNVTEMFNFYKTQSLSIYMRIHNAHAL